MNAEVFPIGSQVKINQGFDTYTFGVVLGYNATDKNLVGFQQNYVIEVTGGVDVYGNPAKVGRIATPQASHVTLKK